MPPCAHYDSPDGIVTDAPKIMGSDKFKEVMSATRRNNLLNMVKSQNMMQYVDGNQSNSQLGYGQNDNDYYIDTL